MRKPPPPPTVVHKRRRAKPDPNIRTWHTDNPPPQQIKREWMQSEVSVYVNRLRMANDPSVVLDAAEKLVRRDEAEGAMASIIAVPNHPLGAGYLVFAKKGRFNMLGRALGRLFSMVNFVQPQRTEMPPSSLRPFVKHMRKGE